MKDVPVANRLHIGIFGRRNAGKSSFINALTGQNTAIVSETPGTTTDPVGKTMEIKGLGPVFIYDTAGIDDSGELGAKRVEKTRQVLRRINLAVVVTTYSGFNEADEGLLLELKTMKVPAIVLFNKMDVEVKDEQIENKIKKLDFKQVSLSCTLSQNIDDARKLIIEAGSTITVENEVIVADLVKKKAVIVLVVPIDLGAPKGRIILPQVQVIRDALDHGCIAVTAKETELKAVLKGLKKKPGLVICDSQAIERVAKDTPRNVPLTTFSIAFSRLKGDFESFIAGVDAIEKLKDGDKVLVIEACTHHPQVDDIGRMKIPRWLKAYTKKNLEFEINAGPYVNQDLTKYKLLVSCGACMINRQEMMRRVEDAARLRTPITNYGILISYVHGALDRTLKPYGIKWKYPKESKFYGRKKNRYNTNTRRREN